MMERQEQKEAPFKAHGRVVLLALFAAIATASLFVLISVSVQEMNFRGNIMTTVTSASAVMFSALVVFRQKLDGLFGRAYAALASGMTLWFVAEMIWAYNSIVLGIELPFPSFADVLWLAGYGPLGFHLFSTSRIYGARIKSAKTLAVSVAVAAFSLVYIYGLVSVSELTGPNADAELAITIAYPVLDAILVVPAVIAILNSGKGELTAIPWIFISWVLTVLADSLFGFTAVMGIAHETTVWNVIYSAAYLFMAAGLYWHNRFFILSRRQLAQLCITEHSRRADLK